MHIFVSMYILVQLHMYEDDGKGNTASEIIGVLDFSEEIAKFEDLIPSKQIFDILGNCNIGRKYNKKFKMLIDTNHKNSEKITGKLTELLREKQLNDVLSI